MSKTILFATGNSRKIAEARKSFLQYGIGVVTVEVNTDEIQHHDSREITKAKALAAFAVTGEPVVVQDTSWNIPALGGFPGGYMKDVANWWQAEDWLRIMAGADRRIICIEHVAYCDANGVQHFSAEFPGLFTDEPRGTNGNSIERTVILYNDKTLAQMHDDGDIASASEGLEHWQKFATWYKNR
ncbi:MAG: hypothetical protein EOO17_02490 [Chloroflexi bacterium]|nr:MAG: hypothetical protein EOO17_02490 [Chloroflexota bacterium]